MSYHYEQLELPAKTEFLLICGQLATDSVEPWAAVSGLLTSSTWHSLETGSESIQCIDSACVVVVFASKMDTKKYGQVDIQYYFLRL